MERERVRKPMRSAAFALSLFAFAATGPATAQNILNEDGTFSLAPRAEALKTEISSQGAAFADIQSFYENRAYLPLWLDRADRRSALLSALEGASDHGLPAEVYGADRLADLFAGALDASSRAAAELAFTKSYLTYATHVHSGLLVPKEVNREILHEPRVRGTERLLTDMARTEAPAAYLDELTPKDPQYTDLMREKKRLEQVIASGSMGAKIPTRGLMRPGYVGDRVLMVRDRLNALGYGYLGESNAYDEALVEVVRQFQTDHKLTPDAVMGPATIGAMNKSATDRLEQVLVNLERHRWLNYEKGARHIWVNIADYSMAVMDNGVATFRSKVVVGKRGRHFRTPEFSKDMTHLIVNPFWHVPRSIAGREYLPMLKQDPMALSKRGLLLMNRRGQVLNTAGADFSGYTEGNFPFLIKQPPGARNALGRVKFMFPNKNNIYLHDTPAKKLFARDARAYSHGCVRVEKPFELAYHLLGPQEDDPKGVFHWLLNKRKERQVNLDTPVPVYLSYHTAFTAEDGTIAYREDIYGRDGHVLAALREAGVSVDGLSG